MKLTGNKKKAVFAFNSDDIMKAMIDYISKCYHVAEKSRSNVVDLETEIDDNDEVSHIILTADMSKYDLKRKKKGE